MTFFLKVGICLVAWVVIAFVSAVFYGYWISDGRKE